MTTSIRLVRIPTTDGLLLDGAVVESPTAKAGSRAWVFVHGTGSNFTAPGILEGLATLLASRGEPVLRLNTRGHDFVAKIPTMDGSVRGGAAFEQLRDAPHDIAAACAWLIDNGFSTVSLLGHSLGGVKCICCQAEHAIPEVDEIVALSPPRLRYEILIQDKAFRDHFNDARQRVDAGRGKEWVEMTSPLKLWMPAEQVIEKYGPEDRVDFVERLPLVHQPTLIVLDTKSLESSAAFRGLDDAVTAVSRTHGAISLHRHPDDIRYRGAEVALANQIVAWRNQRNSALDAGI